MLTINETEGLCMTCNNTPSCYFHASRGPALFCELFDNYVPPEKTLSAKSSEPPHQHADMKFAGLCMNCDHRMDCNHSRPESGVWHCEDYE